MRNKRRRKKKVTFDFFLMILHLSNCSSLHLYIYLFSQICLFPQRVLHSLSKLCKHLFIRYLQFTLALRLPSKRVKSEYASFMLYFLYFLFFLWEKEIYMEFTGPFFTEMARDSDLFPLFLVYHTSVHSMEIM